MSRSPAGHNRVLALLLPLRAHCAYNSLSPCLLYRPPAHAVVRRIASATGKGDRMRSQDPPLKLVAVTIAILLVEAVVNAAFSLGPLPLVVTIVAVYVIFIVYGARTGDHTVWLWLVFGVVTGGVGVLSDCDVFLVRTMKDVF